MRINRKLVLIGTSAIGLRDIKTTPIDPAMSGVEVHAQILESVLSKSVLTYPNYAIGAELAAAVIIGLAIIALGPVLGASMMLALGAVVAAVLAAGSWYFFAEHRLLIDATYPLLATFLIYLTLIFINYFREQTSAPPHPHGIRTISGAVAGRATREFARNAGARRRRSRHDDPVQRRARLHHDFGNLQA